ncbi:hypothetical protein K0B04_02720 [Patescibacteria group bacterium]|nr:hypothetical protein [Patescibacteria group bacterium]
MNGSLLIFGGNKNKREDNIIDIVNKEESKTFEKIKDLEGKPDIHIVTLQEKEKSIGISQTREGTKFLRERPFSYNKKFLIILNSEKLTTQAQNSLLKTLEEPPSYALIILSAKTQNSLLETIVSRCKMISLKSENKDEEIESEVSLKKILKMSLGERLDICSEISKEEKEYVLEILEKWVGEGRELLLKNPKDATNVKNIKRIIEIKNDLENTNVNVRLSLEALVLSLT